MSHRLLIDSSWTLFLDRDGVINERLFNNYVLKQNQFVFCDGALKALEKFNAFFKYVIVVTNQQCVAKGLIKQEELDLIHQNMCEQISLSGGVISKVYAATELKEDPLSTRKPNPTMAIQAQKELEGIDFSKSIMVGDTDSDIEFGKRLGMITVLIESNEKIISSPDFRFASLYDFSLAI
jgi:histidinol-phosphate phosphatase family protein